MWKNKKLIITVVLTVVVLGSILGGYAVASADEEEASTGTSLLDRVAEIYEKNTGVAIDAEELEKAFTEARQSIHDEARDKILEKLVEDSVITQEQADEFKAWLDARPDFLNEEFKEWLESRPDIPGFSGEHDRIRIGPFEGMHRGFGKFGGGFGGKFFGWCTPDVELE